jgi:hypothetical protein
MERERPFVRVTMIMTFLGALAVAPLNAQLTWTHLSPGGSVPSARQSSGAVYVKAPRDTYGAMYIFGGYGGSRLNDMYKLTLRPGQEQWTRITQQSLWPSTRTGFVMVYDSTGNRILGYGGDEGNYVVRGDNWAFNMSTSRWEPIDTMPGFNSPPSRVGGDVAYSTKNHILYLFGGTAWRYPLGWYWHDTWRLDPGTGTWLQLSPQGLPIPRSGGVAIIDEVNSRMILSGGILAGSYTNETWAIDSLNQSNKVIKQLFPGGSPPPAMRHSVAVYDSTGNNMIVFSGQDDGGSLHNEVWELRLTPGQEQWRTLNPGGQVPPSMYVAVAVLDKPNSRMIVFGGNTGSGQINDVYALGPLPAGNETPNIPILPFSNILQSVHPNPTNGPISFDLQLSKPSKINLKIYDLTGRLVKTMNQETVQPGSLRFPWDGTIEGGKQGPSGVYFYELSAGEQTFRGKITKTK